MGAVWRINDSSRVARCDDRLSIMYEVPSLTLCRHMRGEIQLYCICVASSVLAIMADVHHDARRDCER